MTPTRGTCRALTAWSLETISLRARLAAFQNYAELREMAVSFDAVYKQEITSDSGRQTRFVIVGRPTLQSSWQIVSIGTGP